MQVVRYDSAIAAANGYEVRTNADGSEYSVKKGASESPGISPYNEVTGNCGLSYVYEYGIGNRAVELYTGYQVNGSVHQWYWRVRLDDRGGSSYRSWQGGSRGSVWQVDVVIGGLTTGGARATVMSANSVVFMTDGRVCYSGAPTSTTTIY